MFITKQIPLSTDSYDILRLPPSRAVLRIALLLLLVGHATVCSAQTAMTWIGAPRAAGATQVWFRRCFERVGEVDEAIATIATTGHVRLYVNGRLVNPAPLTVTRGEGDGSIVAMRYDVSAYVVRPDSLELALWWAAPDGAKAADCGARCSRNTCLPPADSGAKVALRLWCRDAKGRVSVFDSDSTWMCRPSAVQFNAAGGESIDGTQWHTSWSYGESDWARWSGAAELSAPPVGAAGLPCGYEPLLPDDHLRNEGASRGGVVAAVSAQGGVSAVECRVAKVLTPTDISTDGDRLVCRFDRPFVGFLRVTLRDAVVDETVSVGNMRYVCRGTLDEQMQGRFSLSMWNEAVIMGDRRFRPSQVQRVEGLVVERCE